MGQFKPMVKMYTDEPSVILKLKKGGKVHHKAHKEHHEEHHGHKPMHLAHGGHHEAAEHGKAPKKPSMAERRRAMNPNMYAKGGKVEKEIKHEEHEIKKLDKELKKHEHAKHAHGLKHGGKAHKASGGAIDKAETRTTIEGNAKKYEHTKMHDGAKHDKHHGTKDIKEGKPAGYKHGGHAMKHHKATGGAIPADTHEKVNKGKIKMKGTIEGNEHDYVDTQVHQAKHDKAHGTKGIKEGQPAGYKKGGKVPGVGRAIEGNEGRFAMNNVDDGEKFDPAHGTRGVRESNAGGYKKGGSTKKAYATGGNVVDDGKAEKMPRHFVSRPVANSLQSGTFKKGGKVGKYAEGNSVEDLSKGAYDKAVNEKPMGSGFASKVQGAIDKFFGAKPANSVTKTKESVTVTPAGKKRGGKA
jgi:hypothetical protein